MTQKEIGADRVAIYIRWSTEDQSEGTTLAVQMEACRHYVASQGWIVREDLIFIDNGYSGGSLDRPAITKLRTYIQNGNVDCVVVFKLDRLSRSVIDTVTLVLQEWDDLTYLKSAREPVDTTSAMGKQFFYMLVSYAEWERNVIRERMFGGKMRRATEGRSPGFPAPYAYKKGPSAGRLAVIDEEAHVVRLVYDLVEQGRTVRFISKYLNEKGYQSRKGAPWGTSMVSKMLHNPAYTGKLVWGRTRVNPRWKKAPGETRVKATKPHVDMETENIPAIITQKQYDRVQRLMDNNRRIPPAAVSSNHLLTGLIRCEQCGRAMQYNAYERWAYYRCGQKQSLGLCEAPSLRAEGLEEAVIDALRERFEHLAGNLAKHASSPQDESTALQANMTAVESQIVRLDSQERRINQDYRAERLTAGERHSLLLEVLEERTHLLGRLTDLKQQLSDNEDLLKVMQEEMTFLTDIDLFRSLLPDRQKHILRFFIREIRAEKLPHGEVGLTVAWKGTA